MRIWHVISVNINTVRSSVGIATWRLDNTDRLMLMALERERDWMIETASARYTTRVTREASDAELLVISYTAIH